MPKSAKPTKAKKEPKKEPQDDARPDFEKDGHKLSNYNKKRMLQILKHTNCNPDSDKELSKGYRTADKAKTTKEYINEQAKLCQQRANYVMEKEGNAAFLNLNEWAARFKGNTAKTIAQDTKDMCIPLILELIGNTEVFPSPDKMGGIDLQKMYATLANLMAGNPVVELNAASKEFLRECYKELLDAVHIEDVSAIQNFVDLGQAEQSSNVEASIADIECSNERHLAKILLHNETNPLGLPISFMKN